MNTFDSLYNPSYYQIPSQPQRRVHPLNIHSQELHKMMTGKPQISSVLGKRGYQITIGPSIHEDIHKKIKTTATPIKATVTPQSHPAGNYHTYPLDFRTSKSMIPPPHCPPSFPMISGQDFSHMQRFQNFLKTYHDPQNFSYFGSYHGSNSPTVSAEEISYQQDHFNVKQEEILEAAFHMPSLQANLFPLKNIMSQKPEVFKFEELKRSPSDLSTQDGFSKEVSNVKVEEPALAALTKSFPDWDIATICDFLVSGMPKDSFEKEKLFRTERKKRRREKRKQAKQMTKKQN